MGKLKQLHIDCTPDECIATGYEETCYMSRINEGDVETPEAGTNDGGDFNAGIDIDRE